MAKSRPVEGEWAVSARNAVNESKPLSDVDASDHLMTESMDTTSG